jgi:hypothetical protein
MIEKSLPPMIGALLAIQSLEDLYSFYQSVVALGSEEVLQKFYLELESGLIGLDVTHQEKIFRIFENEESEYGLLNKIRLWEDHKPFSLALLERLQKVRINELENYYGDLIYLLVKRSMTLQSFAHPIQEEKLESYIYYLTQKYEDISLTFYAYLKNNDPAVSLEDIRMRKILARLVLLIDSLDNEKYEWVFDRYVQDGVTYIRKIYRDEILQTENAYLLKNNEEEFLLYMRLAQSFSYSDQANYVRYLKYALLAYPYMNRGIERLLAQMETRQTDFQPAFGDELKAYSQIVKVNAKNLIEKGLLNEAAQIIREYEQIIADDPEIAEMKDYLAALANNRYA